MESFEELDLLMQDVPSSHNHGRKSTKLEPRQDPSRDGLSWPGSSRQDLSLTEEIDFLHSESSPQSIFGRKQSSEHGLVAHRGLLTEDELSNLDLSVTRSFLEEEWDLPEGSIRAAYQNPGTLSAARKRLRSLVDEKVLESVEKGAGSHLLAMALGWKIRTRKGHTNDCLRMSRTLTRARKERRTRELHDRKAKSRQWSISFRGQ